MSRDHRHHARLRKRDSELTVKSTPTYAGGYIDKVSEKYSLSKDRYDDRGRQSLGDTRSFHELRRPSDYEYDNIDGDEDLAQVDDIQEANHNIGVRDVASHPTDQIRDMSKKVEFESVS